MKKQRRPKSLGLNVTHIKQIKQKEHQKTEITDAFLYALAAIAGLFIGLLLSRL